MEINEAIEIVCSRAAIMGENYNQANCQYVDAFAEVEIHGVKYEVQMVLEPRENYMLGDDSPLTVREIVE